MEFSIDVSFINFNSIFSPSKNEIAEKLVKASKLASQKFTTFIVKRWLTGRKSGDVGLNRSQSGNYARSWFNTVTFDNSEGLVSQIKTNIPYARVHEYGRKFGNGNFLRKRTFIMEDFKRDGLIMFLEKYKQALTFK